MKTGKLFDHSNREVFLSQFAIELDYHTIELYRFIVNARHGTTAVVPRAKKELSYLMLVLCKVEPLCTLPEEERIAPLPWRQGKFELLFLLSSSLGVNCRRVGGERGLAYGPCRAALELR